LQPQTWIGIYSVNGWTRPQELSLELAGSAWSVPVGHEGFNGVLVVHRDDPVLVRLFGVEDCSAYALFWAGPGSAHRISFDSSGVASVAEVTGSTLEYGPGLNERDPTGCGEGQPQTWIGLYYPTDWTPTQSMSLELAGSAWDIPIEEEGFDGVVIVYAAGPVDVRLYGVEDCTVYAAFRANHGSSHTIRFDAHGTVRVEDITGSAIPFGPGMNEREPTGCGD
jgi:hypothetical protein